MTKMTILALLLLLIISSERVEAMVDHRFRSGEQLKHEDLDKIVDQLLRQITGGRNIQVRTFGDRLVVSRTRKGPGVKAEVPKDVMVGGNPRCLYADPDTGLLFIGTAENSPGPGYGPGRIYRYNGSGIVDQDDYEELTGGAVWDIVREPVGGKLYACTSGWEVGGTSGFIYESDDDGDSWTKSKDTLNNDVTEPAGFRAFALPVAGSLRMYCIEYQTTGTATLWVLLSTGKWTSVAMSHNMGAWGMACDVDQSRNYIVGLYGLFSTNGASSTQILSGVTSRDVIEYGSRSYADVLQTDDTHEIRSLIGDGQALVYTHSDTYISVPGQNYAKSDSYLYAVVGTASEERCRVFRSATGASGSWSQVDADYDAWGARVPRCAVIYKGRLWVGCSSATGEGLWKCPSTW